MDKNSGQIRNGVHGPQILQAAINLKNERCVHTENSSYSNKI